MLVLGQDLHKYINLILFRFPFSSSQQTQKRRKPRNDHPFPRLRWPRRLRRLKWPKWPKELRLCEKSDCSRLAMSFGSVTNDTWSLLVTPVVHVYYYYFICWTKKYTYRACICFWQIKSVLTRTIYVKKNKIILNVIIFFGEWFGKIVLTWSIFYVNNYSLL